jgi:hypothetical protein
MDATSLPFAADDPAPATVVPAVLISELTVVDDGDPRCPAGVRRRGGPGTAGVTSPP